ncbi:hypothetical protein ALC62_00153 [Cyphomyrmex costatus]|uniref:Uncharacterized protein n=1 Tax=Cyphomyrmex costatus TaxID=456900 RepID=A0A151K1X9_9HYME|nr:hypothetical protein ALC62_02774 [Cyphomyrmex costatus]KYN50125.1 hypothetical protein ALC62_00153 [Cyphomyrmex costatus]
MLEGWPRVESVGDEGRGARAVVREDGNERTTSVTVTCTSLASQPASLPGRGESACLCLRYHWKWRVVQMGGWLVGWLGGKGGLRRERVAEG